MSRMAYYDSNGEEIDPETGKPLYTSRTPLGKVIDKIETDEGIQFIVKPMPEDTVNHPSHYTNGKIECIDALESATAGLEGIEAVCTANAIKYLWRWKHKNGIEDLKKAQWYINHLIEKEPSNEED